MLFDLLGIRSRRGMWSGCRAARSIRKILATCCVCFLITLRQVRLLVVQRPLFKMYKSPSNEAHREVFISSSSSGFLVGTSAPRLCWFLNEHFANA